MTAVINGNYVVLSSLTSLVSVELRENSIRSLPASCEKLKNLERLDLGDNELTDLPPFIGQLTKLTELWLDHNLLFRLPKVNILWSITIQIQYSIM